MADMMQFELVSPERMLASFQASEALIPGFEGDFTAMPAHQPIIASLRPGLLRVAGPDGPLEFVISGGFAEVAATGVSVLAERAVPREEATREFLDEIRKDAEATHDAATGGDRDAAAKNLADIAELTRLMA